MNFISKFFINREINKLQDKLTKEYEVNGATDEIIDKQIEINTMRNLFDIPDDKEKIYKKFVQ